MTKKIAFDFLVEGIMCHAGCGQIIQNYINECLETCINQGILPGDAKLSIDAEPQAFGIHRLLIQIKTEEISVIDENSMQAIFKHAFPFKILERLSENKKEKPRLTNWVNMLVNLVAIGAISTLSAVFPPSILLTVSLTSLSFLTTAFTARTYLINFFRNLRYKSVTTMATTITLGWVLSCAHTLYHSITMPLASSFSMTFMSFIMPSILITIINGMDEIKRLLLNESKQMHLQGMKKLFPEMAQQYDYFPFPEKQPLLSEKIEKSAIQAGMIIQVQQKECFPVDCELIEGRALIDTSVLTGEHHQSKHALVDTTIQAGAINLGDPARVRATSNAYNSALNKLLFKSNRAKGKIVTSKVSTFTYLYSGLILLGIASSVLIPLGLGIVSIPLLLQNVTGILFAVCPCTIAIAHQLPNLLAIYHRGKSGVLLRGENLIHHTDEIKTVVFDKTGTLTTGNSEVESFTDFPDDNDGLWQRIYLLEKYYGGEHPLAKAIISYYKKPNMPEPMFDDIEDAFTDPENRGLTAMVQNRRIHIGNSAYLQQECKIQVPIYDKLKQGFSPVYVAENGEYKGVIFIKHKVRNDTLEALFRLKNTKGTKIIMLTGDNEQSAIGFNQQNESVFELEDIHWGQTPENKETFLDNLMNTNPKNVWFVGDGLNDALCARKVSDKGGISCAITSNDKAAFFSDISLNGSLKYLFKHNNLNQFMNKIILQNQGLLIYSLMTFLAFIVTFSITGIAVSPLIPLMIMVSTTLFTLFNAYRIKLAVGNALDKTSWAKRLFASDLSFSLLLGSSFLLMSSVFISTVATGALTFPAIVFTAGAVATISAACVLTAITMAALFVLLGTVYLFTRERGESQPVVNDATIAAPAEMIRESSLLATIAENEDLDLGADLDIEEEGLDERLMYYPSI